MRVKDLTIIILILVVVVSVMAVSVTAVSTTTTVTLKTTGVNLTVDSQVAEWGYTLSTESGTTKHSLFYPILVKEGSTIIITVNLPDNYELSVYSKDILYDIKNNSVTISNVHGSSSLLIESKYTGISPSKSQKMDESVKKEETQTDDRTEINYTNYKREEVNNSMSVKISDIDENGYFVNVPLSEIGFSDISTGTITVREATEEYNALNIGIGAGTGSSSSGGQDSSGDDDEEDVTEIEEFHVETTMDAMVLSIPVSEDGSIGGNGNAPILVERSDGSSNNVSFWSVIEVTPSVSGGKVSSIFFEVPLSSLSEEGFTPKDVVMYHGITDDVDRTWYPLVTTLESIDAEEAHYSAETDGASPFGILFLKDTTRVRNDASFHVPAVNSPLSVSFLMIGILSTGILVLRRNNNTRRKK